MTDVLTGNFSANGDSETFVARKFTVLLGTDTNKTFGGGTVSVKYKQNDQLDWTTDDTTYADATTFTSEEFVGGLKCKLTLSGATTPNIDYSIRYE